MVLVLDEYLNVRMVVFGNYIILFFEFVLFIYDNVL